ncbi:MAG: NADH-quinone oxidoreductase subunit A [Thermoplasmatota archaeon]
MDNVALLQFAPVFLLAAIAFVMIWATLGIAKLFGPRRPVPGKLATYESGEVPIGPARGPIDVQYYLYVLVFLVVDIEAVFLIPWALQLRNGSLEATLGAPAFLGEMAVFVILVLFAWAYAWRKGALQWQA